VQVLGLIPARLGSERLTRKPLRLLGGVPLIVRVVQRLCDLDLCDRVAVATDAPEIREAVEKAGFEAVMTSESHGSGTERVAEALASYPDYDIVLNVQGDEPFVDLAAIEGAVERVRQGDPIGTAAGPIGADEAADPNRVKVVLDRHGYAVYFSRSPIPYDRDGQGDGGGIERLQHIGVYAYTREALERWIGLEPVPEERAERLEQLRPLLHGIPIGVARCPEPPARGIDTLSDLAWAEAELVRSRATSGEPGARGERDG
jgi:3-deoxy-manno-octulosonate cytidylyltransferase (CMP-KDO synthetase)